MLCGTKRRKGEGKEVSSWRERAVFEEHCVCSVKCIKKRVSRFVYQGTVFQQTLCSPSSLKAYINRIMYCASVCRSRLGIGSAS